MAIINRIENTASVTFDGAPVNSNSVETLLLLAPTVLKVVDKLTASLGEALTYTVTVTNVGLTEIIDLPFTDILPAGTIYVEDSFTVNSSAATPDLTGNTLTYTVPSIAALGTAVIGFQVEVVGGDI